MKIRMVLSLWKMGSTLIPSPILKAIWKIRNILFGILMSLLLISLLFSWPIPWSWIIQSLKQVYTEPMTAMVAKTMQDYIPTILQLYILWIVLAIRENHKFLLSLLYLIQLRKNQQLLLSQQNLLLRLIHLMM